MNNNFKDFADWIFKTTGINVLYDNNERKRKTATTSVSNSNKGEFYGKE